MASSRPCFNLRRASGLRGVHVATAGDQPDYARASETSQRVREPPGTSKECVNFLPSALSLTRRLSKGSRLLKRLGQSYSIERRCSMTSLFNLTGKAALVTGGN